MPVRLLLSMLAAAILFLLLAFTSDLRPGTWIKMDVRQVQTPAYLVGENATQCLHSAELLIIDHSLAPNRVLRLQAALEQLHNRAEDPFWQRKLDVFAPKAIWLNPTDFSIGTADNGVKVDRRVRRIEVKYPAESDQISLKLIYDFQVSDAGQVVVSAKNSRNNLTTPIPVALLQNDQQPAEEFIIPVISDCVANALPRLRPDLQWQLGPVEGKKYCLLQGRRGDKPLMNFERPCPKDGR